MTVPARSRLTPAEGTGPGEAPPQTEGHPRPFLKWAGGKAQLLRRLAPLFPTQFRRYVEPFLGGGAVYCHLRPEHAVLGDSNSDLIEAWTVVRNALDALTEALDLHIAAAGQDEARRREYYYLVRAQDPAALDPVARAARLIYMNKTCYNGLYRVNRAGRFNVPFGRHARHPQVYNAADLRALSALLRAADLRCADFATTLAGAGTRDFIYLDPPYDPLSATANFTGYTAESFPWSEQERLCRAIREADARGARFLLNNSDTPNIRALYEGFHLVTTLSANRAINSDPAKRRGATEVVITNYRCDPGPETP